MQPKVEYIRLFGMSIQEIIKVRRADLHISQQQLAEMAEVSVATVKDIERGTANPSLHTLQKIGVVIGMEVTMKLRQTI